jgi:Na+-transporting methylmalonyl-CoA/oxaloacetate decarboxylase beta subunit
VDTEIIPLLIFLGLGAMTDFEPMLNYPYTILLGAAAQFGVFVALVGAVAIGFDLNEAASIGIIEVLTGRPRSTRLRGWHPTSWRGWPWLPIRTWLWCR